MNSHSLNRKKMTFVKIIFVIILIIVIMLVAITEYREWYYNEEICEGLTRYENSQVHNGMTEEGVRSWAENAYGKDNFILEIIPYEDSMITNLPEGHSWHNGFDPQIKEIILDNGDTAIVVGPSLKDNPEVPGIIDGSRKSYWEEWEKQWAD